MRPVLAITCVVLLAASCTSSGSSVATSRTPLRTPSLQPVIDTESFVRAVESAGYKVKEGPTVIPPGFGGFKRRAERITIAGGDVWAFEFSSVSAYDKMRSRISGNGQRIGDATFAWTSHLYGSGRLIVLYVGNRRTPARDALNTIFGKQFAGV